MDQAYILEKFTVKCSAANVFGENKKYRSYLPDFKGKLDYFIIIHLESKIWTAILHKFYTIQTIPFNQLPVFLKYVF